MKEGHVDYPPHQITLSIPFRILGQAELYRLMDLLYISQFRSGYLAVEEKCLDMIENALNSVPDTCRYSAENHPVKRNLPLNSVPDTWY